MNQSIEQVRDKLSDLMTHRDQIASRLREASQRSVGELAKQTRLLSHWFDNVAISKSTTPQQTPGDAVLHHPDALSICVPLLNSGAIDGSFTQKDLNDSIRHWESVVAKRPSRNQLWLIVIYPLVLALICTVILMLICVFLVPSFEQMMDEFGLDLPTPTKVVFAISHIARDWGLWMLGGLALIAALLTGSEILSRRSGQSARWIAMGRRFLTPSRAVWADWAEHVALLLDAGLSREEAILIAGESTDAGWLRGISRRCIASMQDGIKPLSGATHYRGKPCHLMIHAVQVESPTEQADVLREVALIYHDRDRHARRDWLVWLSPVVVCLIGMMTGWVMIALFMPLVSLISGLT